MGLSGGWEEGEMRGHSVEPGIHGVSGRGIDGEGGEEGVKTSGGCNW